MRPRRALMGVRLFVVAIAALGCQAVTHAGNEVREPTVAGQFYPADAARLTAALEAFFANAVGPRVTGVEALVLPHAGIVYSGQIAADGYAQALAQDAEPEVVVILGTNHTVPGFDQVGVSPARAFRTPLGEAVIDRELAQQLVDECDDCVFDARVHATEHSVEVQIPFIQHAFPNARIVPLVVGSADPDGTRRFGRCLAKVVAQKRTLIVASSDLSHYPGAEDAGRIDRESLETIASLNARQVRATLERLDGGTRGLSTRACGEAPILVAIHASRERGASQGVVLSYANSGRMLVGDPERVVGYGAVAFISGEAQEATSPFEPSVSNASATTLSPAQQRALLGLARRAIETALSAEVVPVPRGFDERLWVRQGAFVTLKHKKNGELRGCIGTIPPDLPLAQAVGRMALSAALNDPRFPPVRHAELASLVIEISALTPPRQVSGPQAIKVGTHGVILEKDGHSAVFLPQVAPEQGWDRDEMLDQLCHKAGLDASCWRARARLSTFEAQVFREGQR